MRLNIMTWSIVALRIALTVGVVTPQAVPPPPVSQLPLSLVGVFVEAESPRDSKCLVRCPGQTAGADAEATLFGLGDKVCGVAELTEISTNGIVFKNLVTARTERLPLKTSGAPATMPTVAATPSAPTIVSATAGRTTVEVPQTTVQHYLLNLQELLTSALAVPHYREGGNGQQIMDGFELREIKAGSVVEQVGLRNGDVLSEVNGEKLDGLPAVLRLAAQVQNVPQNTLIVLRASKPMTFIFKSSKPVPSATNVVP